jgi:hypothetical protein
MSNKVNNFQLYHEDKFIVMICCCLLFTRATYRAEYLVLANYNNRFFNSCSLSRLSLQVFDRTTDVMVEKQSNTTFDLTTDVMVEKQSNTTFIILGFNPH